METRAAAEHHKQLDSGHIRRGRRAAVFAASLALTIGGINESAVPAAEGAARNAAPGATETDVSEYERFDAATNKKLLRSAGVLERIVLSRAKGSYAGTVEVNGQDMFQMGISYRSETLVSKQPLFTQVVAMFRPGEDLPFVAGVVTGSPSPQYTTGESYRESRVMVFEDSSPSEYLLAHSFLGSSGVRKSNFYAKKGRMTYMWVDDGDPRKVTNQKIRREFNSFFVSFDKNLKIAAKQE